MIMTITKPGRQPLSVRIGVVMTELIDQSPQSRNRIAAAVGMSRRALHRRLTGVVSFNIDELVDVLQHIDTPTDSLEVVVRADGLGSS